MVDLQFSFISNTRDLSPLLEGISKQDIIALDTEADSMHHYAHKLCLLQFTVAGKHWLVDPLSEELDISPLLNALNGKLLLLHGADYDLRMLKNHFNFSPDRVYDTMIAAQLLGKERLGLVNLVKEYFDVDLTKSKQKADWTKRPLPEDMKQYAALDTYFLHEIHRHQVEELETLGRMEWLEESTMTLLEITRIPSKPAEDPWRIRGSSKLGNKELAILKSIWMWREERAAEWDRPPFKVLSPAMMLECTKRIAHSSEENPRETSLPRLPRNFKKDIHASFIEALVSPLNENENSWPKQIRLRHKVPDSPSATLLDKIKNHRDTLAAELKINETLIANRQQMVSLALHIEQDHESKQTNASMMNWQYALMKPVLETGS